MRPKLTVLCILSVLFLLFSSKIHAEDQKLPVPLGLDQDMMQIPADNPITQEKIELGKRLYFDPRLSKDGTISCATCHDPKKGFSDGLKTSEGIQKQFGNRNSPTVINAAFNYFMFWDGRVRTLEEQASGPMENPVEMGHTIDGAVQTIQAIEGYKPYFKAAFGDETVTIDRIVKAIATYERTVLSGNSAWDKYLIGGDETALSESAKRGLVIFEGKGQCTLCHTGFNLTDGIFHNLGVGMSAEKPDLGRYEVTKNEIDKGAFKTPTLRDLEKTAPYMHDGSVETIEEVIELYVKGGEPNPWLDPKVQPVDLTGQEKADLAAFLRSLEGDWVPDTAPELPE